MNEAAAAAASASAPSFVGEMLNMTVPVGRDVDLDCQVKNAEGYKVSEHATTPAPARPIFVLLRDGDGFLPPRWVHFGRLSFLGEVTSLPRATASLPSFPRHARGAPSLCLSLK